MDLEQLSLQLRELVLSDLEESNSLVLEFLSLEEGKVILDKIKEQDPYHFLSFILHTFGSFDLGYMLIYIPFIWENITIDEVTKLFINLSDNERYDGIVALMSFLARYIKVNPLHLFENSKVNKSEIRDSVILNRKALTSSILTDKLIDYKIKENFKNHLNPLQEVKKRFLSEGAIEFETQVSKRTIFEKLLRWMGK